MEIEEQGTVETGSVKIMAPPILHVAMYIFKRTLFYFAWIISSVSCLLGHYFS